MKPIRHSCKKVLYCIIPQTKGRNIAIDETSLYLVTYLADLSGLDLRRGYTKVPVPFEGFLAHEEIVRQ